jgi:hypothetical protein
MPCLVPGDLTQPGDEDSDADADADAHPNANHPIHAPHGRFRPLAMIGTCPSTPVTLSCSMVARRPKRAIRCGNAAVSCDEVRRRHSHMEWW